MRDACADAPNGDPEIEFCQLGAGGALRSELKVEGDHIVFGLPGSVAPWKQETALDQDIQTTVEKVKVKKQRCVCVCPCTT